MKRHTGAFTTRYRSHYTRLPRCRSKASPWREIPPALESPREGQDWPQATQRRREIPPPTLETQRGPRLASGHTAKPWEGRNWKPCTEALPSMSPLGMGVLALFPYWTLLSEHCSATLGHTHDTPPAPSPLRGGTPGGRGWTNAEPDHSCPSHLHD